MDRAEQFIGLFVPHDPHTYRFYQIVKYLRDAVIEYILRWGLSVDGAPQ